MQAIGISRGGRSSKLDGLTDPQGRPRLLILSAGNINDMTMAARLLEQARCRFDRLIDDRGYDTKAVRSAIAGEGAEVVLPTTASWRAPIPNDRKAYKARNLFERLWCRIKDDDASQPATTSSPETSWQQH